jgi:hypothetical protein
VVKRLISQSNGKNIKAGFLVHPPSGTECFFTECNLESGLHYKDLREGSLVNVSYSDKRHSSHRLPMATKVYPYVREVIDLYKEYDSEIRKYHSEERPTRDSKEDNGRSGCDDHRQHDRSPSSRTSSPPSRVNEENKDYHHLDDSPRGRDSTPNRHYFRDDGNRRDRDDDRRTRDHRWNGTLYPGVSGYKHRDVSPESGSPSPKRSSREEERRSSRRNGGYQCRKEQRQRHKSPESGSSSSTSRHASPKRSSRDEERHSGRRSDGNQSQDHKGLQGGTPSPPNRHRKRDKHESSPREDGQPLVHLREFPKWAAQSTGSNRSTKRHHKAPQRPLSSCKEKTSDNDNTYANRLTLAKKSGSGSEDGSHDSSSDNDRTPPFQELKNAEYTPFEVTAMLSEVAKTCENNKCIPEYIKLGNFNDSGNLLEMPVIVSSYRKGSTKEFKQSLLCLLDVLEKQVPAREDLQCITWLKNARMIIGQIHRGDDSISSKLLELAKTMLSSHVLVEATLDDEEPSFGRSGMVVLLYPSSSPVWSSVTPVMSTKDRLCVVYLAYVPSGTAEMCCLSHGSRFARVWNANSFSKHQTKISQLQEGLLRAYSYTGYKGKGHCHICSSELNDKCAQSKEMAERAAAIISKEKKALPRVSEQKHIEKQRKVAPAAAQERVKKQSENPPRFTILRNGSGRVNINLASVFDAANKKK